MNESHREVEPIVNFRSKAGLTFIKMNETYTSGTLECTVLKAYSTVSKQFAADTFGEEYSQLLLDKINKFQGYYDENGNKLLCDSSDTTVYSYDTFGMLKNMSCPAVLAEQCFITNPSDVESFGTEEGCQRAAQAYYKAICNYLEHAK